MEKRAEQASRIDSPAQIGFETFIDAVRKYPDSGMAMAARIQQIVRENNLDPIALGEALFTDDVRIGAIRRSGIGQHKKYHVRRSRVPEITDDLVRKYVDRAFRNAQILSVLSDSELNQITGELYSEFAGGEGDGEASINYFVRQMLSEGQST